jgi:hypothetical protein
VNAVFGVKLTWIKTVVEWALCEGNLKPEICVRDRKGEWFLREWKEGMPRYAIGQFLWHMCIQTGAAAQQ